MNNANHSTPRHRRGILRRLRGQEADQGVALVIVVGTMLVLASLALVTLAYTMAGQKFARYDQDYAAAMSAAQSGVDDFISRLNRSDQYGATPDCHNDAEPAPNVPGNACGWGDGTAVGWAPVVPGETDPRDAFFHYSVDASQKSSTGVVVLTVTGRVNGVYRTIQSSVGKRGSTDYVYYTDFESADPANEQAYGPGGTDTAVCGANGGDEDLDHWYQQRKNGHCQEIQFIAADTLNGAVFSNDAVLSTGATFTAGFETHNPTCQNATDASSTWNSCLRSGSSANFNGVRPQYAEQPLYLQDNTASFATDPGCHYYGATRLIFEESGKVIVYNNKLANGGKAPVAIPAPGGTAPDCGGDDLDQLTNGVEIAVPDDMVIYADTVAGTNSICTAGEIGGPTGAKLPLGTYSTAAPTNGSATQTIDENMLAANKACNQGNLYAEGVLKGRVTIAAAQSVVVTGDLVLAGGLNGDDMLGLVATNSVEVFHPVMETRSAQTNTPPGCNNNSCKTYYWGSWGSERQVNSSDNTITWPKRYKASTESAYTPTSGLQIAGSIQTLQHSFLVQKYDSGGNMGRLLVNGSIAQKWRGIVGQASGDGTTATNGYVKLYQYDTRLVYTAPPYFPPWVNAEYSQRYTGEIRTPGEVKG